MSDSYRIRTQVGVDKSVRVQLDQDFESLEILSLKILQSDIYTRQCSDYGVVVGRVTVNNGLGIPNARISVFIPLSDDDSNNPIISSLYPYKSLNELNDDGFRYNLLPYEKQHGGHNPTGTFFNREDVLINPSFIEVYDKYYRYTCQTNESGDYMIFGVPIGTQTIHVDIDLSDIGEFSLSPQDLVRLGFANENQLNGTEFKSSFNFADLPQIVTINRTLEVEPFWGQPEICNLGITRTDFDLQQELGLKIEPTAIFMGSIISNVDEAILKQNCNVKPKLGEKCSLIAGPGQILAIRQTIFSDNLGRPILEEYKLEQGGKCIDENGTWLIDVPMNLEYVTTNEYGERVISLDPKTGVPTKAKYRFKIKWDQPSSFDYIVRRGNFLAPNIKEWGWIDPDNDPSYLDTYDDTLCKQPNLNDYNDSNYRQVKASYAFSLNWDDYAELDTFGNVTSTGQLMIDDAISCRDRFYYMTYNKVYSVSQLLTEYRSQKGNRKYIGIKNITNEDCNGTANKFPSNDGQKEPSFLYTILNFLLSLLLVNLIAIVFVIHILIAIVCLLSYIVWFIKLIVCSLYDFFNWLTNLEIAGFTPFDGGFIGGIAFLLEQGCNALTSAYEFLDDTCKGFTLNLPMYTYPDCEFCDCSPAEIGGEVSPSDVGGGGISTFNENNGNMFTFLSQINLPGSYTCGNTSLNNLISGFENRVPSLQGGPSSYYFTSSLHFSERLNLYNTKAKYFNESTENPGGGWNRVKVSFNVNMNDPETQWHLDNIVVLMINPDSEMDYTTGNLITFQDYKRSTDPNLTGSTVVNSFNNNAITGTPTGFITGPEGSEYYQEPITVSYANPDGSGNLSQLYLITGATDDANYCKFPIDLEYFQIIHSSSVSDFIADSNPSELNTLTNRFLNNYSLVTQIDGSGSVFSNESQTTINNSCFNNFGNQILVFLVRGVDSNSTRTTCQFDLSRIYGYDVDFNTTWNPLYTISGQFKLNIPIQGSYRCVRHNDPSIIANSSSIDSYSNEFLYYNSFHFLPSPTNFLPFQTNLTTFYSKIDESNVNGAGTGVVLPNPVSPNSGLVISPSNGFTKELYILGNTSPNIYVTYPSGPTLPQFVWNWPTSTRDRGYYRNEIVEGGSFINVNPGDLYPTWSLIPTVSVPTFPPSVSSNYYCEKYQSTDVVNINLGLSGRQIVMRSDRLPTSTSIEDSGSSTHVLFSNNNFGIFPVPEEGFNFIVTTPGLGGIPDGATLDNQQSLTDLSNELPYFSGEGISNSPSCGAIVPLRCYGTDENGILYVKPPGDSCYENGINGELIIKNGSCYSLISVPIVSLLLDFALIYEWVKRVKTNIMACQGVFGHIFTNNWINGTLFAFPFNNTTRYTTNFEQLPGQLPPNTPYSCYCKHNIFLNPDTQNFYYRSSPYKTNIGFIGRRNPVPGDDDSSSSYGGNSLDLMYPTTLIDLGPRTSYSEELSLNNDYNGYVMDRLSPTTFKDTTELLNLFILSRTFSSGFISTIIQTQIDPAIVFFPRKNNKIAGDYAQMDAINSQLGVQEYQDGEYGASQIYFSTALFRNIFGIFYNTNLQTTDLISPKRNIINQYSNPSNYCTFDEFPITSQEVPFYLWKIRQPVGSEILGNLLGGDSIFGSSLRNNWDTLPINGQTFHTLEYQEVDRVNPLHRNMQPVDTSQSRFFKGFISNSVGSDPVTLAPSYSAQPPTAGGPSDRKILQGAPYYFYFGLKPGATAYDRFQIKWIKTEIIE